MNDKHLTLDVGCGNDFRGNVNVDLLIPDDIWQGKAVTCNKKLAPNFIQASAYSLPFNMGSFEKVVCYHTIEHLSEPIRALKEMIRVSNEQVIMVFPSHTLEVIHALVLNLKKLKWLNHHHHKFDLKELKKYGVLSKLSFWEYKLEVNKKRI